MYKGREYTLMDRRLPSKMRPGFWSGIVTIIVVIIVGLIKCSGPVYESFDDYNKAVEAFNGLGSEERQLIMEQLFWEYEPTQFDSVNFLFDPKPDIILSRAEVRQRFLELIAFISFCVFCVHSAYYWLYGRINSTHYLIVDFETGWRFTWPWIIIMFAGLPFFLFSYLKLRKLRKLAIQKKAEEKRTGIKRRIFMLLERG